MQTKKTTLLLLKLLDKILSNEGLHARFLNTLSYIEYVGARKMLKSLPAHILNKNFLDHISEETRHSLFFKTLAQKIAKKEMSFKDHEMILGEQAFRYFQAVDHYSAQFAFSNPIISYLYTTYAIEQRAVGMYSIYNELLLKRKSFFTLNSVLKDEHLHLKNVLTQIKTVDPMWEKKLEDIIHFEHKQYFSFLIKLEDEINQKIPSSEIYSYWSPNDSPKMDDLKLN